MSVAKNPTDAGAVKDPSEWKTGNEPMTASQQSYLHTLAQDCGEPAPDDLTKAEASELIDELRKKSARVQER